MAKSSEDKAARKERIIRKLRSAKGKIRTTDRFKTIGAKSTGMSEGFLAQKDARKDEDKMPVTPQATRKMAPHVIKGAIDHSRPITILESFNEMVAGPIAAYMVANQDNSSKIFPVRDVESGKTQVGVRFLGEFTRLDEYVKKGGKKEKLDFSEPLALSLLLGDIDFHAGNVGVRELEDGTKSTVRIDFGRALLGTVGTEFDLDVERLELDKYQSTFLQKGFAEKLAEFANPNLADIKDIAKESIVVFLESAGSELDDKHFQHLFTKSLGRIPASYSKFLADRSPENTQLLAEEMAEIVKDNIEKRCKVMGALAKVVELNSLLNGEDSV